MATLTPGIVLEDGDTVTNQTLHNMLENATIGALAASDFIGSSELLVVASSAPDPSDSHFWWDSDFYLGQVFKVYAAPWNVWVTVGPDRFEIPFRNDSGGMLHSGALVVPSNSAASACLASSNPSLSVIGFTQATAASGAYVPVAICGIGAVAYGSSVSAVSNTSRAPVRSEAFTTHLMPAGRVGNYGPAFSTISGSSANAKHYVYGMYLESNDPGKGAFPYAQGFRAIIWGPKLALYDPE